MTFSRRPPLACLLAGASICLLASCHVTTTPSRHERRRAFDALARTCLEEYYAFHPTRSTEDGLHLRDEALENRSAEALAERARTLRARLSQLAALDRDPLAPEQAGDAETLAGRLRSELLDLERVRSWERDPCLYLELACRAVASLCRATAPPELRAACVIRREEALPRLLDQALANLGRCPRPWVEEALERLPGALALFRDDLPAAFASGINPRLAESFARSNTATLKALEAWRDRLEREVLPRADGAFALGEENYRLRLLCEEQLEEPIDRLLERGESALGRLRGALEAAAAEAAPDQPSAKALAEVLADRPPADTVLAKVVAALETARRFTLEKGLVTLPLDVPCEVRACPAWRRGEGSLVLDLPGPFEPRSHGAALLVALPAPEAPAERREEELSAFGAQALPLALLRVGYPGLYALHLRLRGCASPVRRAFRSRGFSGAWARYAEEAALAAGFGGGEPRLRLAALGGALRGLAADLAEVRLHAQGWSLDEATEFLVRAGGCSRPQAAAIARRRTRAESGLPDLCGWPRLEAARAGALPSRRQVRPPARRASEA
ncbi:MAG: DUF885 family protein [Planctomycetes bacterium]|nr:DUF885 family protein [Planctomycetota bacterium]